MRYTIVSHHLLRRRARAKKRALEREDPRSVYSVVKACRGPFRWHVRRFVRRAPLGSEE